MTRHPAPHRLAALDAGELDAADADAARDHLASCSQCRQAVARVQKARRELAEIARERGPRLAWHLIWPRIHWIASSDRRRGARAAERRVDRARWTRVGLGVATLCAGAALVLAFVRTDTQPEAARSGAPLTTETATVTATVPDPALAQTAPVLEPAQPLVGVVTMMQGQVWIDAQAPGFDEPVTARAIVETGNDGRIAVQFGEGSAFSVAPNSSLRVRALDSKSIVLDIQGEVEVEISRRARGQQFVVLAGERRVEVRGTAFRVANRAGELDVACGHGHVVVRDGGELIDVRAGQVLSLLATVARRAPVTVPAAERAALERSLVLPKIPVWSGGRDLLRRTGRLVVEAPAAQMVSVDGRRVGAGSFALRVIPGRHRIDAARLGEWVDVAEGEQRRAVARGKTRRAERRTRQLEAALVEREVALRRCVARLDREGLLHGTSMQLELGVNRDGSQGFLNIVDTNLPTDAAHCLRDVVDGIQFPRGSRATLREILAF